MRIHNNTEIEDAAIQTIVGMQLGLTEEDVLESIQYLEDMEAYEQCQGMVMGLQLYKDKTFGCKVSRIMLTQDGEEYGQYDS